MLMKENQVQATDTVLVPNPTFIRDQVCILGAILETPGQLHYLLSSVRNGCLNFHIVSKGKYSTCLYSYILFILGTPSSLRF